MKLGGLVSRFGAAAAGALVLVPLLAGGASASHAAPASYTAVARAYPLQWSGSGALPVFDIKVPYVSGITNNVPATEAKAVLAQPDLRLKALSGDEIAGLSCTGFDERKCTDPFLPEAVVGHLSRDGGRTGKSASFDGPEGKFPGRIRAVTDCPGDCGHQLVRTSAEASGPAGSLEGYLRVGASSARHDVTMGDGGRLVSEARSELRDVAIGPNAEVTFSSLSITATASGSGAPNGKDGRAELKVSDLVILDNPVELTRAGLRLARGAPSEQEAYDGAKSLLAELERRGIRLELPDFSAQVEHHPDHVAVRADGLRVVFEQSVVGPPGVPDQSVTQVFDLGSATAVVAAFDQERDIDVSFDGEDVAVEASEDGQAPVSQPPDTSGPAPTTPSLNEAGGGEPSGDPGTPLPSKPGRIDVRPGANRPAGNEPAGPRRGSDPADGPRLPEVPSAPGDPDDMEGAISVGEVTDTLGRNARSVSRAFGAFLGLGLILPMARFVIKRLG